MNKTKKQIIFFILIVIVGVCYSVSTYIIIPKKVLLDKKAKDVQAQSLKLQSLKSKSSEVVKVKAEVAKLKEVANSIKDFATTDINTPQLVFDFYTSCTQYGIKGEDLIFQLADSNANAQDTNKTATSDNTTVNDKTGATSNEANSSNNATKTTTNLLKLTIELKVSGDKNKVEDYIRNLNALTLRKINVKSIRLEAIIGSSAGVNGATTNTLTPADTLAVTVSNQVTADIVFNQYIYTENKDIVRSSNYSFYDEKTGFTNFSDMFK